MPRTVLTFGTFDVYHVGHLRVIERAAAHGDRLVVGVSSDALNLSKKGREPVFSQGERLAIIAALKPVDEVFLEESLELKRHYIERPKFEGKGSKAAKAEWEAEHAEQEAITVMRAENGRTRSFKFNYKDVARGKKLTQNIQLQPGDTVVIP